MHYHVEINVGYHLVLSLLQMRESYSTLRFTYRLRVRLSVIC